MPQRRTKPDSTLDMFLLFFFWICFFYFNLCFLLLLVLITEMMLSIAISTYNGLPQGTLLLCLMLN